MNQLIEDAKALDALLNATKNQGLDYLTNINDRSTSVSVTAAENGVLAEAGVGAKEALNLFNQRFEPIMVASSGPRFWGFVTGGSTPASIVGDWLATVYDQNTQGVTGHGDVSANIEVETISLLLDLFGLPKSFLGGFVTGATMSNFTCLAVARQWLGKCYNKDFAKEGITEKINVLSATPHSSAIKSLSLLGIGSGNVIKVNAMDDREAISITDLEQQIEKLNGQPFILISSGGTVNTVDFDDFTAIKQLKQKYNFWWHIDAAFGGFAACSTDYAHLLKDWEYADSITIDNHKWLNVPYESAVFLVKEEHKVLQTETFQNSNAPYLGDPMENFSYLNFLPENSRRLKALPAWFTLTAYGKEGYRAIVDNCITLAHYFQEKLENSDQFMMLAPVILNNLCFTIKDDNQDVSTFLADLNKSGKVFMTPTFYNGRKGIRASFVNWRTTTADVDLVFDVMVNLLAR
ncbi:pyridoxal phosphate-dependent decarboxylase family protein [Fulvivirga ligni]|uniref:pyridoxal phosphate-dependent decarboxylase family protein n=1 Tax=Fulvivirga ligni TaxID=2904246 RepID=UPI001F1BFD54|nr:pyridoxal-dependent decarboxylase [Fulvivirga ligni]UII24255.1 pyridoxal-dependent decarboxylase [Fulvivirga ligni]